MVNSTLFIFTNEYPYGDGETYIVNELSTLSKNFQTVVVFPLQMKAPARKFPKPNIESVVLFQEPIRPSKRLVLNNFFLFFKILTTEFLNSRTKKQFILAVPELKSRLLQNIKRAELLSKFIDHKEYKNIFFYSFWTDDWATALSILRKQRKIDNFISRVHGYDLYEERWPNGIIPFRYLQLTQVKTIFTVSEDGLNYMIRHYPKFNHKFKLSRLNVFDQGNNPWYDSSIFTLVSCSNLIPLKRVQLILDAMRYIDFDLKWLHFGDGEQGYFLKQQVPELPANIQVYFKGQLPNSDIIQFYKHNCVNVFLHMSETEGGVPLAIQEAASFGIPLIAADSGGVREIVSDLTGILTKNDVSSEELGKIISNFRKSDKNGPEFRAKVKTYWKQHFDASCNYSLLYRQFTEN
ncbi:MAG TPA: glycosyltransferase [Bacteroidia bacterium]|nr:glycosyltransferase [Bacteroidia bacterium]